MECECRKYTEKVQMPNRPLMSPAITHNSCITLQLSFPGLDYIHRSGYGPGGMNVALSMWQVHLGVSLRSIQTP